MINARKVIPMSDGSAEITADAVAPTILPDAFLSSDIANQARAFALPSYEQLPAIPLYRDQLISFIDGCLAPLSNDKGSASWITPSMVNNYVKMGLVTPPVKKQYGRDQIAVLLSVCLFKQFLPISAIEQLLRIRQLTYSVDVAYDYVVREVNNAVAAVFSSGEAADAQDSAHMVTRESLLVRCAANAFASKALLIAYLKFAGFEQ